MGVTDRIPSSDAQPSSSLEADIASLPGVCYITYPPTPVLAAVTSSSALDGGLDGPRGAGSVREENSTRLARVRKDDDSFDLVRRRAEGGDSIFAGPPRRGEAMGVDGESSDRPRDGRTFNECSRRESSPTEGGGSSAADISLGQPRGEDSGSYEGFPDSASHSLSISRRLLSANSSSQNGGVSRQADSLEAGEKDQSTEGSTHNGYNRRRVGGKVWGGQQQQRECVHELAAAQQPSERGLTANGSGYDEPSLQQQQPPQVEAETLRGRSTHCETEPMMTETVSPVDGQGGGGGGGGHHQAARKRIGGRRRKRCGNSVLSTMTKEGHPLVASKVFPSLPGVDEHQLPSFWLAEMHDNMRKNR